jgi:hypothetical protein
MAQRQLHPDTRLEIAFTAAKNIFNPLTPLNLRRSNRSAKNRSQLIVCYFLVKNRVALISAPGARNREQF